MLDPYLLASYSATYLGGPSMKFSRRTFMAAGAAGLAGAIATYPNLALATGENPLPDEDGYKLWLRYAPPPEKAAEVYRQTNWQPVVEFNSPTGQIIRDEMTRGPASMLGPPPGKPVKNGKILISTLNSSGTG